MNSQVLRLDVMEVYIDTYILSYRILIYIEIKVAIKVMSGFKFNIPSRIVVTLKEYAIKKCTE